MYRAPNRGEPPGYGTHVRRQGGRPEPATPLADPATVDADRADVGLGPLADSYEELAEACAAEG